MSARLETCPASGEARGFPQWADISVRLLAGAWFTFASAFYFTGAWKNLLHPMLGETIPERIANEMSIAAIGFFLASAGYLYVIRLRPVSKFAGLRPAVVAILGTFVLYGVLLLPPRTDLTMSWKLAAAALTFTGSALGMVFLGYLGRSFSILPECRELITRGPYRFVRHPLYMAEAISTLGVLITFLSPAAFALIVVQLLLQLARIHYEEQVLRATFPAYGGYSRHTARLIPGIY